MKTSKELSMEKRNSVAVQEIIRRCYNNYTGIFVLYMDPYDINLKILGYGVEHLLHSAFKITVPMSNRLKGLVRFIIVCIRYRSQRTTSRHILYSTHTVLFGSVMWAKRQITRNIGAKLKSFLLDMQVDMRKDIERLNAASRQQRLKTFKVPIYKDTHMYYSYKRALTLSRYVSKYGYAATSREDSEYITINIKPIPPPRLKGLVRFIIICIRHRRTFYEPGGKGYMLAMEHFYKFSGGNYGGNMSRG